MRFIWIKCSFPGVMKIKFLILKGKSYKPDFFFYDQLEKLEKIVEIKSRNKKAIQRPVRQLRAIERQHEISN